MMSSRAVAGNVKALGLLLAVVIGAALRSAESAESTTAAAPTTDADQWFPMPEFLPPEQAEFSNIQPGGTADVTIQEGITLNPGKTEHLELATGYYIAFSLEFEALSAKRAWVFLVRVDEVLAKDQAKVRVSPEAAKLLNDNLHVTLFRPKGATTQQLKTFPTQPVEIDIKESFSPRPEPAPEAAFPGGQYLLVTKDEQGAPRVSVVTPVAPAAVTNASPAEAAPPLPAD